MSENLRPSDQFVLVLELTTRAIHCHLVSRSGKICHSSTQAIEPTALTPDQPYVLALDPTMLWKSVCSCAADCVRSAGSSEITAVSTASQRFTTAIIDEHGETSVLCPNTDARGIEVEDVLPESMYDRAFEITGLHPPFLFSAGRLGWFKSCQPEMFSHMMYATTLDGWLYYKLTGAPAEEPSQAAGTFLFDIRKRAWSEELCEIVGVRLDQCPTIVRYGGLVGYPTYELQGLTGIAERTPVVMGAGDTHCSGIGSLALSPGEAYSSLGSTAPLQLIMSEPILDQQKRMWTGCFPIDGRWVLESNAGICGTTFDWLATSVLRITKDHNVDYEQFDALAKSAPSGAGDVCSFLGPSIMDARTFTNVMPAAIVLPSLLLAKKPGAPEIARACYEDIAFACRGNLEQMNELLPPSEFAFRVSGGLTRSVTLVQILADVLARPVITPTERRATAVGSAIAAISYVESMNPSSLAKDLVELNTTSPSEESSPYESSYRRWRTLRGRLGELI